MMDRLSRKDGMWREEDTVFLGRGNVYWDRTRKSEKQALFAVRQRLESSAAAGVL